MFADAIVDHREVESKKKGKQDSAPKKKNK